MKHIYTLEFWRDIKDYEGLYQVNNVGQVKSVKRNKLLKPNLISGGYLQVALSKNGKVKYFLIHRLVAETFLPNENELPEVDHISGDRMDNRVANLQWINSVENNRKRKAGIMIPRRVICIETGEVFETVSDAAKAVNRGIQSVSRNLNGITQTCAGKHFKYYEENV